MCTNNMSISTLAVAALVLLVATGTFRPCRAHPRLLVTAAGRNGGSDDGETLSGAHGDRVGEEAVHHHPDYTVAIARNPFSVDAEKHLPKGHRSALDTEDDLQKDRTKDEDGDEEARVKRKTELGGDPQDSEASASEWGDSLAEPSEVDGAISPTADAPEEESSPREGGEAVFGARKLDPPALEQHFFPSFASIFSPPPPPHSLLGYNHESSISRPRHPPSRSRGPGRSHFGSQHHYPGFESYPGDDEDDSFGLFQGSEHGTLNPSSPRPPPPILQPPRAKLSYHSARQQASSHTDSKHTGLLGSGNFAVMRGGTYYDEDGSPSELRGNYYSDPFGNGHGGPSYNSGGYNRGLPSNPRPRPGREHFADFRDFADITAPKPAFSQLVVVYAANQNGTSTGDQAGIGKNGSNAEQGSHQRGDPPRNIIERLRLLDESESREEGKDVSDHMVLWDGEGGNEEEVTGEEEDAEEEDDGNVPPLVVKVAPPMPNNINDKLKLLDVDQQKEEVVMKKGKGLSLGKRKLALMKEKGKWVSRKAKRLSKDKEPLLALS